MDLILAHKRCMKIAEMCGMPSSFQTRFSTAVSEIARCSIAKGKDSLLVLGINIIKAAQKEIVAIITDKIDLKNNLTNNLVDPKSKEPDFKFILMIQTHFFYFKTHF